MRAPPVLLLVFNRPALVRRLVRALRVARPARLFVAADGPPADDAECAALCRQTRQVIEEVDWPCQLRTLYRDNHLGLKTALISALDWFFDRVEAGIVLEDDCLPAPDFFPFAAEMLDRYAGVPRVMHVSGLNMRPAERFSPYSYFFAGVGHIWGWATWQRAWRLFDATLSDWPAMRHEFRRPAPPLRRVLGRKFSSAHAGRKCTWARIWYYTMVSHGGLAVIPSVNLIRNIGFGPDATHTTGGRHPLKLDAWAGMSFPLDHPPYLLANARYERHLTRYHKGSYRRRADDLYRAVLDRFRHFQLASTLRD